jgi:hypothetical protein
MYENKVKIKDYKFRIGDHVVLNEKVKKDLPNDVGKTGYIEAYAATSPNFDYYVDLGLEIRKVKELEIDLVSSPNTYNVGDKVLYLINNQFCKVDETCDGSKEVRLLFEDGTATISHMSNIRKVNGNETVEEVVKIDSQPEDAASRIINLLLTGYKNEDGTYTLPSDVLHKLIEYGLKEVSQ